MARADGDRNSISPLVLIGGGLVVASLTFGGAYLWLGQSSSNQLVVIKAPTTPVRVAPEDPGGLKLNSIDSPVMDLLVEQANQDEKNAEVLVPSESEPELPPIEVAPEDNEDGEASSETTPAENDTAENNNNNSEQVVIAETSTEAKPETEPAAPEPVVSADASTETASVDNQNDAPDADVKEEKTADQTNQGEQSEDEIASAISSLSSDNPAPKPETQEIVSPSDADAPRFVVQFAAFKSETRAKNTAAVLATKHASRLNEITLGYMRRDDYWRVVTEPMPRADATSLCRMFRSVGQDCITKLMEQPQ